MPLPNKIIVNNKTFSKPVFECLCDKCNKEIRNPFVCCDKDYHRKFDIEYREWTGEIREYEFLFLFHNTIT